MPFGSCLTRVMSAGKEGMVLIVVAVFILLTVSQADALIIEIENLTDVAEARINLEFNVPESATPFLQSIPYSAGLGESFFTNDIPEISIPGTFLTRYGLVPSGISGARDEMLSDGLTVFVGNTGVWDSALLTFHADLGTEVIPEPASLLLMGSGVAGLWFVGRRKNR